MSTPTMSDDVCRPTGILARQASSQPPLQVAADVRPSTGVGSFRPEGFAAELRGGRGDRVSTGCDPAANMSGGLDSYVIELSTNQESVYKATVINSPAASGTT